MNRRNVVFAGVVAIALAACSQATDVAGTVKQIADVVQQVQSGVKLSGSNIGTALTMTQQAVDVIAKACPVKGEPATMSASQLATVNGKNVDLRFY